MKKKPGIRGRKPKILKENLGCHSVEKVKAKRVAVRSMDDEQILVSETGSDIHVSPPASPGHNQSASVAKAPDRNEFTRFVVNLNSLRLYGRNENEKTACSVLFSHYHEQLDRG